MKKTGISLLYCSELNIYRATNHDLDRHKTMTQEEVDSTPFGKMWALQCKQCPNKEVYWHEVNLVVPKT